MKALLALALAALSLSDEERRDAISPPEAEPDPDHADHRRGWKVHDLSVVPVTEIRVPEPGEAKD